MPPAPFLEIDHVRNSGRVDPRSESVETEVPNNEPGKPEAFHRPWPTIPQCLIGKGGFELDRNSMNQTDERDMSLWKPSVLVLTTITAIFLSGCATRPGKFAERKGDEIMVAGKLVHTGTRVVLWTDPGGYDAYRTERRFSPLEEADWETSKAKVEYLRTPSRFNLRKGDLTPEEIERVRGGGWDIETLQRVVDQFVIHFDVAGTSCTCFKVLHDNRGLSVHFMLDVDGTIYQTLDAKERAFHATSSNDRSVGIEIANMGAYSDNEKNPFDEWYQKRDGKTVMTVPERFKPESILQKHVCLRPSRPEPIRGEIQGREVTQYDFTPEQYKALAKLTAALCNVFPQIKCDYPRGEDGQLITRKLPDDQLKAYQGVLGHYHIQTNKIDPGPAFQWDYVVGNAQRYLRKTGPNDKGALAHVHFAPAVKLKRKN